MITKINDINWDIIVAKAAPLTPKWKKYINNGSKPIFKTHPIIMVIIAFDDSPWAVKYWFNHKWSKTVKLL